MKCARCGGEHHLLDPAFRRPDAVVWLPEKERASRVKENDDLCAIWSSSEAEEHRYFVRCVLKVPLLDRDEPAGWGVWGEVAEADFRSVMKHWRDPDQASLPAADAKLANRIPGYPETLGLTAKLRMTGLTTRPALALDATSSHPFALECRAGVSAHRVMEWLAALDVN